VPSRANEKGANMAANDKIVAEITKYTKEVIRITLGTFNNRQIAGLRVWFKAEDGSWRPGKAGIAFKVELLLAIAEGLSRAVNEAREQGLL
jgi:hypothetical protein